jgi:catechol 2,3-dioxygenase-like lactoylglutathione lyase family enzyme
MVSTPFGKLRFLYVGSADVKRDLDYYVKVLGSRTVWDRTAFGTRVAAVELCDGPLLLLAGHRPAPSILPIFQVDSLKASEKELRSRGWKPENGPFEIPNGPCYVFRDPSGNQLAIFQDDRPEVEKFFAAQDTLGNEI